MPPRRGVMDKKLDLDGEGYIYLYGKKYIISASRNR